MESDVIVLGAGIIGVSAAIHLARRGRQVVLIDRRPPGEETSFGNAGLIQREGVVPYGFPQQFGLLMRYALNKRVDASFHWRALPSQAAFLARYWWHSNAGRHQKISAAYAPLIAHSISEHADLIAAAGAGNLIARNGWQEVFRSQAVMDAEFAEAERLQKRHGVSHRQLSAQDLARGEPFMSGPFVGGLHWSDPWSVRDPHALTMAYIGYFEKLGGRFVTGDAASLSADGSGWRVQTADGPVSARDAVIALGPWSDMVTRRLGYRFPLGVKRGYHMHYRPENGATLNNWTLDKETGYLLAPMNRGIRLTTGAEFTGRDAPKTPVQLDRAEAVARRIFPLGERLDPEPWMGARPCTPDMMPIIGKAPRHAGLWFGFGHAHHGLTLGPVTGRLLAEAMTGEAVLMDISAYAPERFRP
ncbi:amino acid dehydrogenase [Metarhizobium album]|uniref:Amino acid dehydrogenase n=1 Tax=Metarhizobium album TaxID=2182425 RepID=A0A2U2DX67_9HYPH|nr:FAD-binding oxidoreductase [Rhizobium album]PWE57896.1 amino acid dehydrogenase [Rhizobium album]